MSIATYKKAFRALANETRLRILSTLLDGRPMNVTELSSTLGLKQSTISHNLKRLLDCGFVGCRQHGHYHYYAANRQAVGPMFRLLARRSTPVEAPAVAVAEARS